MNEPVEVTILMEDEAEAPTRLVGKKIVPILEKENGSHMTESLDIVRYINAIGIPIFFSDPSPETESWLKVIWPVSLKLAIPRFTMANFAELSTSTSRDAYRQREEKAFGNLSELMERTTELVEEITPKLQALVSLIQQRQRTDINDILLWPVLRCLSIVKALTFSPAVHDYALSLEAQTGIPLLFRQAI
jgi:Glutaredoxin 2